jgi:hypothetical protein
MITDFEKQVCDAQINFVLGAEPEEQVYDYYGDAFYPFAQELVNRQVNLFPKPAEKPKPAKMSAKERIVYDNTIRLIGEALAPRRNLFIPNNVPAPLLKSSTLELRSIGFCFMAYSALSRNGESAHGLIVSLQRFIHAVEKKDEFSATALRDLNVYCKKLMRVCSFSGNTIPPELITSAPYDEYVPVKALRPYDHQISANKLLYDPVLARSGFIAVYSTATNSGKTFTAVGLAKRVDRLRSVIPKMQFLFSCVVDSVRKKVENLFQASGISYGVALPRRCVMKGCQVFGKCDKHPRDQGEEDFYIQDPTAKEILVNSEANRNMLLDEGYVLRDSESKKVTEGRKVAILDGDTIIRNPGSQFNRNPNFTAIVCKPEIAYYFLQREDVGNSTVLFLDEFTLNATQIDSKELRDHMNVISVAPKWTYLSNANFVGDDRIRAFLDIHNDRFPSSTIVHIASNVVFSCSNLWTFSGKACLPHMDANDAGSFKTKVRLIYENQFKGRMYNPQAIRDMYDMATRLIKWNFDDEDDGVDEKATQEALSSLPDIDAILSDVQQLYPDNIRKIAMKILDAVVHLDEDEVAEIFSKVPKPKIKPVDILDLDYYNFPGMNLVGHPDPEAFAMKMFSHHLETIKSKITSLKKMMTTYELAMDKWQSSYDDLEKRYKKERDLSEARESALASIPKIAFPDELQIGTPAFLRGRTREKVRIPLDIKSIDVELMKSEDKILLLYAGIGIYSSGEKDRAYLDTVLDLASTGRLEFLVTDISYGMDYPFSCVFISKEFSDQRSMNDIYQFICRGGRGRLSNSAQIYMDETCMDRITSVKDETSEVELRNMIKMLKV